MGKENIPKKQLNKTSQTAFDNQMEYNLIIFEFTLMKTSATRFEKVILY